MSDLGYLGMAYDEPVQRPVPSGMKQALTPLWYRHIEHEVIT